MGEPDISDAGIMYGEWKKAEAERDKLRGEVAVMRPWVREYRKQCMGHVGMWPVAKRIDAALASGAGAAGAAVIKAAVKARRACKEPCECESPLWEECCHRVDDMLEA